MKGFNGITGECELIWSLEWLEAYGVEALQAEEIIIWRALSGKNMVWSTLEYETNQGNQSRFLSWAPMKLQNEFHKMSPGELTRLGGGTEYF